MMKQIVKCRVCEKEFGSWFDFVSHFLEEHADKFIENGFAEVTYEEARESEILKKVRAKYNIGRFKFESIPGDMVRIVVESVRLMNLDVLKDVVKGIEEFAEAVDGGVVEVSTANLSDGGAVIVAKIDTGVDSWNQFVERILK